MNCRYRYAALFSAAHHERNSAGGLSNGGVFISWSSIATWPGFLSLIRCTPLPSWFLRLCWMPLSHGRDSQRSSVGLRCRPPQVWISDLEPLFVCKTCGHRGADVRPLFQKQQHSPQRNWRPMERV